MTLERLKELEQAATPGPWRWTAGNGIPIDAALAALEVEQDV